MKKILHRVRKWSTMQRVNTALIRASLTSQLRVIDPTCPSSWEFCGFSQNREDGVIDFLTSQLLVANRSFVEIGASDGVENNTAFLAIAKKYTGIMVEGEDKLSTRAKEIYADLNLGVQTLCLFITKNNCPLFLQGLCYLDPDVFSLDIDGNDYYVMEYLLQHQFRPKIVIVEYNSAFGPTDAVTIPYEPHFHYLQAHRSGLYYGVSISAWRQLFFHYGYKFITVESNGVNAFFVDPHFFNADFLEKIKPRLFAENFYQKQKVRGGWEKQFGIIQHLDLQRVE